MAIATTNSTAQDFLKKAAASTPGSGKARLDPKLFQNMLQSGYGINGEVGKNSKLAIPKENMITGLEMLSSGEGTGKDAALSMLGYQTDAKALTAMEQGMSQGKGPGLSPGLSQSMASFQGSALATLSRMAMEQAAAGPASAPSLWLAATAFWWPTITPTPTLTPTATPTPTPTATPSAQPRFFPFVPKRH